MKNMKLFFMSTVLAVLFLGSAQAQNVLIVQDEMPQMEVLIKFLEEEGKLKITTVDQDHLPKDFSNFDAVIGFVHGKLFEPTELAIIDYTKNGGKFIALHHTISSGKSNNKYFFGFLGIQLDHAEFSKHPVEPGGGYGWFHDGKNGISQEIVNLHPHHFITTNKVKWGKNVLYTPSDFPSVQGKHPAITLKKTEAYLNHKYTDGREKTVLCGFKYYDIRTNALFMQDRAAWYKKHEKGLIFYFQPGETPDDYANKNISQMILNAVIWDGRL
ncbi:ThuA domain-containing protein [Flammeovirgaceae bacterium SG7u.111]|nr:ThuA domain-containing protein [Flammeovirgaceae bacterium SG7u.132]WPO37544.1 ThuA domain-containing protein [Flammeovirgaceae bacterium SG7u.111]